MPPCLGTAYTKRPAQYCEFGESVRCNSNAKKGKRFCYLHDPEGIPRGCYVIAKNIKPYRRHKDGSYHKHYICIPFRTKQHAWNWMHDNWERVRKVRTGRFVSASVEFIKGGHVA